MTELSARISRYAEASRHLVSRAGAIMLAADDQIADGTFDSAQWAKSVRQLGDLAVTAGLELAPNMMSACAPQSPGDVALSAFIEVVPDNESPRLLSVAEQFVQDGTSYAIPDRSLVFVPAILRVFATRFRVGVTGPDYRSGTYRGRIRLTAPGVVDETDVIVDL